MINKLLVAATVKAFEEILTEKHVPCEVRKDEEYELFMDFWEGAEGKDAALKKVRPAIKRIASKEPYIFRTDGQPLCIRINYPDRKLSRDSFGEIMLERPDIDWRFSISVKDSADVLSTMDIADRSTDAYTGEPSGMFNEIDDFGWRIFGIPCSNEYFNDVNAILLQFEPYSKEECIRLLKDESFLYGRLIGPMQKSFGAELKRICENHPEAPGKLFDYFYGKIDYYYISPLNELGLTRIGCVNAHGGLGCIPGTPNHYTQVTPYPTKLEDVRFATGSYGEISSDTIRISFDGGWAICMKIQLNESDIEKRDFRLDVYMPVTPYGSYRDQVKWEK